jgi:hypothetical protein
MHGMISRGRTPEKHPQLECKRTRLSKYARAEAVEYKVHHCTRQQDGTVVRGHDTSWMLVVWSVGLAIAWRHFELLDQLHSIWHGHTPSVRQRFKK